MNDYYFEVIIGFNNFERGISALIILLFLILFSFDSKNWTCIEFFIVNSEGENELLLHPSRNYERKIIFS